MDSMSLQHLEDETDLIPLMTPEDEEAMNKEELPEILPILPLKNTVLFPGVVIPITAGRDKSIKLINETNKGNKIIGVVSQKSQEEESPEFKDLHVIGTVAQIVWRKCDHNKNNMWEQESHDGCIAMVL